MIKKGLTYLVKALFYPLKITLYLLGWIFQGIMWCVRALLLGFYRFKIYMEWVIQ